MNTSDSYTITFDSGSTQALMRLAQELGTSPSDVIAKALVLLNKVQGKKIILKDDMSTQAIDIKRYVR